MAKQTREQKAEVLAAERRQRQADVFRAAVLAERDLTVVADSRAATRMTNALYRAIYNVERTRVEMEQKLRWLRDGLADLDARIARGQFYSTPPVSARGNELDAAHAAYVTSLGAAASLCAALGIHCPLLESADALRKRAVMLAVTVERVDGIVPQADGVPAAGWQLFRDGAALPGEYGDEAGAWLAFRELVHGR